MDVSSPSAESVLQLLLCEATGKYLKEEPSKGLQSGFAHRTKEKHNDRITSDYNGGYVKSSSENRTYYLKLNASRTKVEFYRVEHTYDGKY